MFTLPNARQFEYQTSVMTINLRRTWWQSDAVDIFFHFLKTSLFFLGWILIDRCGKNFGLILNFLRDGTVALPSESRRDDLMEILTEAKYYCIQQLVELCEQVGIFYRRPLMLISFGFYTALTIGLCRPTPMQKLPDVLYREPLGNKRGLVMVEIF